MDIYKTEQFTANNDKSIIISSIVLSKLLHLVGHIAIREMVHLDTEIYKELKRRNNIRDLKKNKNINKDISKLNASSISNRSVRNKEV